MCIFAADIILINMKRIISIMCATLWTGFAAAQIQTNAGVQYLRLSESVLWHVIPMQHTLLIISVSLLKVIWQYVSFRFGCRRPFVA